MTKIIPRELIEHLEWDSDRPIPEPVASPAQQRIASIEALIYDGKVFRSSLQDNKGNRIGLAAALKDAYDELGLDAIVASAPYLIAGIAKADRRSYLLRQGFDTLTEENAGVDNEGRLVKKGQGIVIIVHGGGILDHDRIMQAYSEGLTDEGGAKYTNKEFDSLLKGILPSGESIELYTIDDAKKGRIPEPFGRYGVWMPVEVAMSKGSGDYNKKDFMDNELIIARAGTLEHLEDYFMKVETPFKSLVKNRHRLTAVDLRQPQGRLLYVFSDYDGINGRCSLENYGGFVAVAPEAQR